MIIILYKIWIFLSIVVSLFSSSLSDLKLLGLLFFIILSFMILFLYSQISQSSFKSKINSINYNYLLILSTSLAFVGFLMQWIFVCRSIYPYKYADIGIGAYVSNNYFELLVNPYHNHLLKPVLSIIFSWLPFKISSSNYLSSMSFLGIYNIYIYLVLFLVFLFIFFLSLLFILKYSQSISFWRRFFLIVIIFIFLKNIIDGGVFYYEFISSIIVIFVIINDKLVKDWSVMKTILFISIIIVFEYLIAYILVGSYIFHPYLVVSFNLFLFGFYYGYKNKKNTFYIFSIAGLIFGAMSPYRSHTNFYYPFTKLTAGEKIIIRTNKRLDYPLMSKYKYFSDYIYTVDRDIDYTELALQSKEFVRYESMIKKDECIGRGSFDKRYYLISIPRDFSNNYPQSRGGVLGNYEILLVPHNSAGLYLLSIRNLDICGIMEIYTDIYLVKEYINKDEFLMMRIK